LTTTETRNTPSPENHDRRRVLHRAWIVPAALLLAVVAVINVREVGTRLARNRPCRHVILISLDTVRADHLGCYGDSVTDTPRIDALARRGVRFARVVTAAPTTLASHTSIMTGTYPHTHGVAYNGVTVHPRNFMLAEALSAAGFTTAGFIGAFALDSRFDFNQGFDHFDEHYQVLADDMGDGQNQRRADAVTDAVIDYLGKGIPDHLFLFVHYFDAHAPYDPPEPFCDRYPHDEFPVVHSLRDSVDKAVALHQQRTLGRRLNKVHTITDGLSREMIDHHAGEPLGFDRDLDALYRGEISFVDFHLGRLIDWLDKNHVLDDAVLVLVADHGETMWEHGDVWNHGLWVYDTTVHVPLVICVPNRPGNRVVATPVSTVDIMPTILDLLHLPTPRGMEGVSLVPALDNGSMPHGPVFSEATQPYRRFSQAAWQNADTPKCIREGPWKYIYAPYLHFEQLFNLDDDVAEKDNLLAGTDTGTRQKADGLRHLLDQWIATASAGQSKMSEERREDTIERLRSLGYVGRESDDN
jgi:arylsulfatase A-like enzyme